MTSYADRDHRISHADTIGDAAVAVQRDGDVKPAGASVGI